MKFTPWVEVGLVVKESSLEFCSHHSDSDGHRKWDFCPYDRSEFTDSVTFGKSKGSTGIWRFAQRVEQNHAY